MAVKTEIRRVRNGEIIESRDMVNSATSLWAGRGCNENQLLADFETLIKGDARRDDVLMFQLIDNDWIVAYSFEIQD